MDFNLVNLTVAKLLAKLHPPVRTQFAYDFTNPKFVEINDCYDYQNDEFTQESVTAAKANDHDVVLAPDINDVVDMIESEYKISIWYEPLKVYPEYIEWTFNYIFYNGGYSGQGVVGFKTRNEALNAGLEFVIKGILDAKSDKPDSELGQSKMSWDELRK